MCCKPHRHIMLQHRWALTLHAGLWLQAEWHNSIMRPCHYVAVDRANRSIVLAIRFAVPFCCLSWHFDN